MRHGNIKKNNSVLRPIAVIKSQGNTVVHKSQSKFGSYLASFSGFVSYAITVIYMYDRKIYLLVYSVSSEDDNLLMQDFTKELRDVRSFIIDFQSNFKAAELAVLKFDNRDYTLAEFETITNKWVDAL